MRHATKNTAGCCDGEGQVHLVCGDDPYYEGPLSSVGLCHDPICMARREVQWAASCGEEPAYDTCPVCDGKGLTEGDGSGWDGTAYHAPGCEFCDGNGGVPELVADAYRRSRSEAERDGGQG